MFVFLHMENRIKTLYIITIIAIISFLGMQLYWLHGRYEFSLKDYERNLSGRIISCVDTYNDIRSSGDDCTSDSLRGKGYDLITLPTFSISQHYGDTVKTTRTAKIMTYLYSAYDLLGIEPGTPLTDEQRNLAVELAQKQMNHAADSVVYDASGARDENEAWTATKNVQIERRNPFTVVGIDSVLNKAGIKAQITLARADSMVWMTNVAYHQSSVRPYVSLTIPYSQLEGQTVTITCAINPLDVLPGMWPTLLVSLLISALLIVCLILQFSTVLKLSRIDKMRNDFITTMIHELKRPLSTLKMCVSGLGNQHMVTDGDVRAELLSETRSALDNLSAYFSKLRDIAFNNVEQIPLTPQNINLHTMFDTVATAIPHSADKTVTVINEIDPAIEVSADRSHLHNILTNLVENAIKYSGSVVTISASTSTANGFIELHISDTGNGIPPNDIRHIFKRFYRGKASAGVQPGMGLGLAYVKLLIDAHGGDIYVESTEGEGTIFTIRLPQ